MFTISRRNALTGGSAAIATAVSLPIAAMASKVEIDPVVALHKELKRHLKIAFTVRDNTLSKPHFLKAAYLQIQIAETPATSIEGLARKLALCCDNMCFRQPDLIKSAEADACRLAGDARS